MRTHPNRPNPIFVMAGAMALACCNSAAAPDPTPHNAQSAVQASGKESLSKVAPRPTPTTERSTPKNLPQKNQITRYNYLGHIDDAHLWSSGVLVDFGRPARDKYTIGDWQTGWRGNFRTDEGTFSYIGGSVGRLFVSLVDDQPLPTTLILRARGVKKGRTPVKVFVNGQSAGTLLFEDDHFSHGTLPIFGLHRGNNEILLRTNGSGLAADGKSASLSVDYLRLQVEASDGPAASAIDGIVSPGEQGITLLAGERLTYMQQIPPDGILFVAIKPGDSKLNVEIITPEGNTKIAALSHERPQASIPLKKWKNQVAGISFVGAGGNAQLKKALLTTPGATAPAPNGLDHARNVVVVLIDTLRADHLSLYNPQTVVTTPFLNRFGKESTVFDRAIAQENWTKPSVASLLTGLYPATHQTKTDTAKLPDDAEMMSEYFQKKGYTTAGFVANGYVSGKFGFKRGWNTWTNYVREGKRNRAQFVADDAVAWLKNRNGDKPFFLYVHTIDPHVPYIPPKKYLDQYDEGLYRGPVEASKTAKLLEGVKTGAVKLRKRDRFRLESLYNGEISYHDDHLTRLYDELERQGLLENTVIVITSDHGEEFFDHGSVGHGHSMYEELLHVPLIVRLPGAKSETNVHHAKQEVSLVDVFPTVCELTKNAPPAQLQGQSLTDILFNKPSDRFPNVVFSEFMSNQLAARAADKKLIYRGLHTTLFDLENDPTETTDRSNDQPFDLLYLRDRLGLHMGRFAPDTLLAKRNTKKAAAKPTPKKVLSPKKATIDKETRKQLRALGYMGD